MNAPDFSKLSPNWKYWPQQQGQKKPVVMLIHGFMGSPEDFNPIAKQLSQDYACIAPCLKGHGLASTSADRREARPDLLPTVEDYLAHRESLPLGLSAQARQIETALAEAQIDQVYGVGYSLGGRVLLEWAFSPLYCTTRPYNRRLKALCLTASHVGLAPEGALREQRFSQDIQIAQRLRAIADAPQPVESWNDFLDFWYGLPLFGRLKAHPDYAQLKRRRSQHDPLMLAAVVLQASNALQRDDRQGLSQLAQHEACLYIAGGEDTKYADLAMQLAQAEIPTVLMPGIAHAILSENTTAYTTLLAQFFAGLRQ